MKPPSHTKSSETHQKSCRALALHVLLNVDRQNVFADEAFHELAKNSHLSKEDVALAFGLVYGGLRHRGNLDWRIDQLTNRPLRGLPTVVVMILRLGAYQILQLDRVPDSAAVNESVQLAKRVKGRDWTGVVNGVLRNMIRQPEPPLPDPFDDPVQALAIRYSCPTWLVQRWIDRLGFQQAEHVCRQSMAIPPLTLRTNTLRCSREALIDRVQQEGLTPTRTEVSPFGLTVEKCGPLSTLRVLQEGYCYVEDEAAQLVPFLVDVQPGHRVLDACAAPGGKSTHMAALMNNQGELVAADRSSGRLQTLQENATRLGITNLHTLVTEWSKEVTSSSHVTSILEPGFDRILVDAPCSGLGVLRRHPEAKWQKSAQRLPHHQEMQVNILRGVGPYLRPGGVLVYSLCSAEPEETTHVISRFCLDHPEFHQESAASFLPPGSQTLVNPDGNLLTLGAIYDMDGFFAARLRKA